MNVKETMDKIHDYARAHGWWDSSREMGTLIALIHSELSEALEADRTGAMSDKIEGFLGLEEEFADVIIRILDVCAYHKLRIVEAIEAKMNYNENRPYRHGGKRY